LYLLPGGLDDRVQLAQLGHLIVVSDVCMMRRKETSFPLSTWSLHGLWTRGVWRSRGWYQPGREAWRQPRSVPPDQPDVLPSHGTSDVCGLKMAAAASERYCPTPARTTCSSNTCNFMTRSRERMLCKLRVCKGRVQGTNAAQVQRRMKAATATCMPDITGVEAAQHQGGLGTLRLCLKAWQELQGGVIICQRDSKNCLILDCVSGQLWYHHGLQ
jgi:hypothetical protein